MCNNPIGIFDSGVGGTSILNEICGVLPNESYIYLADSKNAPYGNKSAAAILELCVKNTEYLLQLGCKLIVVACNTATTNAIAFLRANYSVPFIGIEPAIKPAALQTKTNTIGVLATKGTLSSQLFHATSDLYAHHINVIEQEGKGIVTLIESGQLESNQMIQLLERLVKPMLDKHIDHLVLGCTHYPYLIPILKEILPKHIKIIDSGLAVANQTKTILSEKSLLCSEEYELPRVQLFTNTNPDVLKMITKSRYKIAYLDF